MVDYFKACTRLFALIPSPIETQIIGQSLMTTPVRFRTGTALYAGLFNHSQKPSVEFLPVSLFVHKHPKTQGSRARHILLARE